MNSSKLRILTQLAFVAVLVFMLAAVPAAFADSTTKDGPVSQDTLPGESAKPAAPAGLSREMALAATNVVYDATSNPLPPNLPSLGFQATQTSEFGDYVHLLAGTNRALRTVTVTMSDWALNSDYPVMPSAGWDHPITLNIYNVVSGAPLTTVGSLLGTVTQIFTIPWRPVADPTCATPTAWRATDGNCYNGFAFNITFDMSSLNLTLPNDIIVGIAYNTANYGVAPIGVNGPYDSLNVGVLGSASVGTDDNADKVFWNTSTAAWYEDDGTGGVGTFREDTNWTPNGTVNIQITADGPCTTDCYVDAATGSDANLGTLALPFKTINKGVTVVADSGTVHVAAGAYPENVNVNKHVSIIGAGSGAGDTVVTGAGGGSGGVIQLSASGLSASQPILLKDLRIQPTGMAGISVGQFTQATGTNVSYVELNNVKVVGTNTSPCTEQERGLYVDNTSSLTHLKISNSAFDNLHYGWYFQKQVSADTSTVQYVDVQNTTFNHNNMKGIYAEKLEDAAFTNVTVSQNGYDGSLLTAGECTFAASMAGIDVNLKAGTYQNLTFIDNTITNNALGGAKEGVGLAVKGRGTGSDSSYAAFPATVSDVTVSGGTVSGNERGIRFGEPGKANTGPTNVAVHNVCISGNVKTYSGTDGSAYGGLVNASQATTNAMNNWWGNATGPYNASTNPGGTGDGVSSNVDFQPWVSSGCGGSIVTGNWQNTRTGAYGDLQGALNNAQLGDTIQAVGTSPVPGGATATNPGITIDLNGRTAGPGSPFLTVNTDDMVVTNGVLDGNGSASPAILVLAGADNLIVDGMEIREWADGIQVQGGHTSFKVVNSWLHLNTDAGLQLDSGVSFGGVVTVQGNLFKQNGGNGVQNDDSSYTLDATYNSWGDLNGPTGPNGDGVDSSGVTYAPWTFAELYLDMVPDTNASLVHVNETNAFSVKLKADAAKLYGLSFTIKWDTTNLTYGGITWSAPWASTKCRALPGLAANEIGYSCNLQAGPGTPDPEWNATAGTIATLTFTAKMMPPGNGTWDSFFDIYHEEADTSANAVGGVKVFVNNAGYDTPGPRGNITDTDDGHVIIDGLANYTGFVDLQGRANDSGATVEVYNQTTKSGATKLAQGSSSSSGGYTTAYIWPNQLVINNTYWLYVDRALYLPTTAVAELSYGQNHILDVRPLTGLNTVTLLGGDATNDNEINIFDASCIGDDYGKTSGFTECGGVGSGGSSDVNGTGKVDNSDLTLMGGNFYKTFSPWPTP